MSGTPELTVTVPCATCGGCKRVRYVNDKIIPVQQHSLVTRDTHPCPHCVDGTVRTPVTCAGCRYLRRTIAGLPVCAKLNREDITDDWGCKAWRPKEATGNGNG